MTYADKNVIFIKEKNPITLDLLLPGTAYLEDVLVESTKNEKSIMYFKIPYEPPRMALRCLFSTQLQRANVLSVCQLS